jgi:hypothetical protein
MAQAAPAEPDKCSICECPIEWGKPELRDGKWHRCGTCRCPPPNPQRHKMLSGRGLWEHD